MSAALGDHPLLGGLLGDEEVAAQLSADADLLQMTVFESALAIAEGAEGAIDKDAAAAIAQALATFTPDVTAIRAGAAKDGVTVPELVRQMRAHIGDPYGRLLHFGATSQDVIDTSLVLRLRAILMLFEARLQRLAATLVSLDEQFGDVVLMGRTRMQDALPITASDRIAAWTAPLSRHLARLDELRPRLLVLQFGGPVGTLTELGDKAAAVSRRLADALELNLPQRSWHTQRDTVAELASWLSLVTGSLGKLGEDVALMAQNAIGEIALDGGGASSAMPHKQNPVQAEVLVALARYNATLLGGMHQALIHEQERSGAAWTLEWLVLPPMLTTTGAALRLANDLAGSIKGMGKTDG